MQLPSLFLLILLIIFLRVQRTDCFKLFIIYNLCVLFLSLLPIHDYLLDINENCQFQSSFPKRQFPPLSSTILKFNGQHHKLFHQECIRFEKQYYSSRLILLLSYFKVKALIEDIYVI